MKQLRLMPAVCAVCGRVMVAGRYLKDLWGNIYCEQHRHEHSYCSACSRVICQRLTGGGVTYADGRHVCNLCRQTAIDSKEHAKPIVEDVARWLYDHGIRFEGLILKVNLGDALALRQKKADTSSPAGPWQGQRLGYIIQAKIMANGHQCRQIQGITILSGLPRELFEGTVAHELGHAWLYLARVDNLELWAEEGFCNLLAYILHKDRASETSQYWINALENDPDPIYGEGFRRIRALFKKHGFGEALNYTFKHRRLPPE